MSSVHDPLAVADATQVELMKEPCILTTVDDVPLGPASKRDCHLWENIEGTDGGMLHRAFSLFLFDTQNRLLLQQRADAKITFPGVWANTCCSHPLHVAEEMEAPEDGDRAVGAKRAALRKVEQELGIDGTQLEFADLRFLTRIVYKARDRDTAWGEHEVDYILFARRDATPSPNPNEAQAARFFTRDEVEAALKDPAMRFSPWFEIIAEQKLFQWWDNLEDLDRVADEDTIHNWV